MRHTRTEEHAYYTCDYCDYVLAGVEREDQVKGLLRWRDRTYHFHVSGFEGEQQPWDIDSCLLRWLDARRHKDSVGA